MWISVLETDQICPMAPACCPLPPWPLPTPSLTRCDLVWVVPEEALDVLLGGLHHTQPRLQRSLEVDRATHCPAHAAAAGFEQHIIRGEEQMQMSTIVRKPASTSLGVKAVPWQPAAPAPAPDTHFAVSAATCSPTPRNAAISSMDSSWQLHQGAKKLSN